MTTHLISESLTPTQLSQLVDHTKLTFSAGEDEHQAIQLLCKEAKENGFYAVCVRPQHIQLAKQELTGSKVKVATVIGFPVSKVELSQEQQQATVGQFSIDHKIAETKEAVANQVDELDLVINVAQFKNEFQQTPECPLTLKELKTIVEVSGDRPVKVIIESDLLSEAEIEKITELCALAQTAMVKTSTGMVNGGQGGTPESVGIIRQTINKLDKTQPRLKEKLGIKASGGIKTLSQVLELLKLNIHRIGTSSGKALLSELLGKNPNAQSVSVKNDDY